MNAIIGGLPIIMCNVWREQEIPVLWGSKRTVEKLRIQSYTYVLKVPYETEQQRTPTMSFANRCLHLYDGCS